MLTSPSFFFERILLRLNFIRYCLLGERAKMMRRRRPAKIFFLCNWQFCSYWKPVYHTSTRQYCDLSVWHTLPDFTALCWSETATSWRSLNYCTLCSAQQEKNADCRINRVANGLAGQKSVIRHPHTGVVIAESSRCSQTHRTQALRRSQDTFLPRSTKKNTWKVKKELTRGYQQKRLTKKKKLIARRSEAAYSRRHEEGLDLRSCCWQWLVNHHLFSLLSLSSRSSSSSSSYTYPLIN